MHSRDGVTISDLGRDRFTLKSVEALTMVEVANWPPGLTLAAKIKAKGLADEPGDINLWDLRHMSESHMRDIRQMTATEITFVAVLLGKFGWRISVVGKLDAIDPTPFLAANPDHGWDEAAWQKGLPLWQSKLTAIKTKKSGYTPLPKRERSISTAELVEQVIAPIHEEISEKKEVKEEMKQLPLPFEQRQINTFRFATNTTKAIKKAGYDTVERLLALTSQQIYDKGWFKKNGMRSFLLQLQELGLHTSDGKDGIQKLLDQLNGHHNVASARPAAKPQPSKVEKPKRTNTIPVVLKRGQTTAGTRAIQTVQSEAAGPEEWAGVLVKQVLSEAKKIKITGPRYTITIRHNS